jgi:hypothetical protein
MLEALDAKGLLRLLSPGLSGAKLNTAGLTRLEKAMHSVLPPGSPGGLLAFISVLTEKLNMRERADAIRAFELSAAESATLKKLEAEAKKLESSIKSSRIHRPSDVWGVLHQASTDEIMMVLYNSNIRVVQDRIKAFYEKYLPQAQEVTEEEVAATGAKPGTPKFEKAMKSMITARLNARPRKPVEPEPTAIPELPARAAPRG